MKQNLLMVILSSLLPLSMLAENISFADANVKAICVANWDTNGDGELSKAEATAVTNLGDFFRNNETITSFNELQYFTGLSKIGDWSFQDCRKLQSVIIPNSVKTIGVSAFSYTALSTVDIPNSVTTLEEYAFGNCEITYGYIPQNVTTIKSNPFAGCNKLESIRVASGNPNYDSRSNCNAIINTKNNTLQSGCKNTKIPTDVVTLGSYAFSDCKYLTTIDIPKSVTTLDAYAFGWCENLSSISFSKSIIDIHRLAFSGCNSLSSVDVEAGNQIYDSRNNCNAVIETKTNKLILGTSTTVIPSTVTAIADAAFDGRTLLTAINIPTSVTSIGRSAFSGCSGLLSINIPASVKSISESTFSACYGLKEIILPASMEYIADYAFSYCWNIQDIYIYAESVLEVGDMAFATDKLYNITLHVPSTVINAYKSASPWKDFKAIVPIDEEPVIPDNLNNIHVSNITITEKMFDLNNPVSLYLNWSSFSHFILMDALIMSASQFDSYYWADCMEGGTVANQDVGYVTPNSYYETFNGINGYRLKVYNFGTDIYGNNGTPPTQGGAQFETSNAFENKELGTGWYFPNSAGQGNHEIVWILSKEEADFLTLNRNNSVKVSRWICFKAKNESAPYGNVWVKLTLSIRRMPTGIISTKAETTDVIYDIKGQKIIRSYNDNIKPDIPKGIYIVNGKKLVINN